MPDNFCENNNHENSQGFVPNTEADSIRTLQQARRLGGTFLRRKKGETSVLRSLISLGARAFIDAILLTGKTKVYDPYHSVGMIASPQKSIIGICWHRRLLALFLAYRHLFGRSMPSVKSLALVSESSDGELIARIFRDAGGSCIRGSSSRRAKGALKTLLAELQGGANVLVTPDGPRGPCYSIKQSLVQIAKKSGCPILPLSGSFGRSLCFQRSWDQFQLPLPFGNFSFLIGEPLFVPALISEEEEEKYRKELQRRMMELELKAQEMDAKIYRLGKPRLKLKETPLS